MTAVGSLLICILQVTLVATVGIVLSLVMRRWLKASAALPLVITLLSVTLLTCCSFSSWPSWLSKSRPAEVSMSGAVGQAPMEIDALHQLPPQVVPATNRGDRMDTATTNDALAGMIAWVNSLSSATVATANKPSTNVWTVGGAVGWVVVVCFVVGLIRLAGGLLGVRLFVLGSRPLESRQLLEQVDLIRAELGCKRRIELRESKHLAMAATVGWRRPVVLLSESWRSWTEVQLRSILAHEIAHIQRGDFLATVFAQLGLLLHFYHPLIHWLANRLRLEQELAADALAAQIIGGSRVYLDAIGELALKHSSEPVGWPAHSFLPTRRTFLRRIEMLRDLKLLSGRGSGATRWATTIGMVTVTLIVIGLRPPGTNPAAGNALAQVPAKPAVSAPSAAQGSPLVARFVPEAAAIVAVVRPSQLCTTVEKLGAEKLVPSDLLKPLEMFKDVTQATVIFLPNKAQPVQAAACLIFNDKGARDRFEPNTANQATWQKTNLLLYQYEKSTDGRMGRYFPDEKTIIIGEDSVVQQMILTAGKSLSPLTQTDSWNAATSGVLVVSVGSSGLSEIASQVENVPAFAMFSPLWMSVSGHTLGAKLDDRLRIALTSKASDQAGAKKIEATMQAAMAMLTNMFSVAKSSPDESVQKSIEALIKLVESHKLKATTDTELQLQLEMDMESLGKFLIAPLSSAKLAGDRERQANSMKQLGLALHNYHGAHGRFPAAVTVDPESGMKRSWRVELLPYMDGMGILYNQYKTNEAWDSPDNMKVLKQMPAVFRHPSQPRDSTSTAITAAYGEGLLFGRSGKGTPISTITDGTSNTVAFLEAKTDIPWTKPEDIEIDLTKDNVPEFGGFDTTGYNVGMADGSVKYFAKVIDIRVLKALLTIAGGERE
ncbi:MAG: M56 family metallopeptidase [Pirellulaceae bacterium]|nr:M56 family metallopeptidase [Pirellulaceae bacterium]